MTFLSIKSFLWKTLRKWLGDICCLVDNRVGVAYAQKAVSGNVFGHGRGQAERTDRDRYGEPRNTAQLRV